jgi:transcriptional regulator of NAD metabolism
MKITIPQTRSAKAPAPLEFSHVTLLLERPIAYHPIFAKLCGDHTAGLMLSQIFYWTKILDATEPDRDGWFYKTRQEWHTELLLSRKEQETARKKLRNLGLLEELKAGIPARLFYKLNKSILLEMLNKYLPDEPLPPLPARKPERSLPVGPIRANKTAPNGQTLKEQRLPHSLHIENSPEIQNFRENLNEQQLQRLESETDEMIATPAGHRMFQNRGRDAVEEMVYRSWF